MNTEAKHETRENQQRQPYGNSPHSNSPHGSDGPRASQEQEKSQKRTEEGAGRRGQSKGVWLAPLGLVALAVGLYFAWPSFHSFVGEAYQVLSSGEQGRVEEWVGQFGGWAFAVILALMLLQTIVAFLPSVVTMVAAVVSFGGGRAAFWRGAACSWPPRSATPSGAR